MKRFLLPLLLGLALGVGLTQWRLGRHAPDAESAPERPSAKPHSPGGIQMDPATQARLGLVVEPLATARVTPEIPGFARVLDPSSLVQQWQELVTARAALDASRKELDRLRTLFAQGQNASARALESGEAILQRDASLVAGAESRLRAAWGLSLINRADWPALRERLNQSDLALVRIELPAGSNPGATLRAAWVASFGDPAHRLEVELLGRAPALDPLTQGPAFLGWVATPDLSPGTALEAWVTATGLDLDGIKIPATAVVRHEGETFLFVAQGVDRFVRTAVVLALPITGGWLATEGVTNGEPVVVIGAQALLSAEFQSEGGAE